MQLLKAILAIELVHRNVFWRFCEYAVYMLIPESFAIRKILSLGRFQVKAELLTGKTKLERIRQANNPMFVDRLLCAKFPEANWLELDSKNLDLIVQFYNGDRTGAYKAALQELLNKPEKGGKSLKPMP